ncbi:MAG: hypothetical protein EBU52_01375 [Cytophagia bacterium]|nr:hypothetical protein [Cytophagia bacterium]
MTTKMKYRLTPFHLVSLYFLYEVVAGFILNARLGDKAELGALLPFIYLVFFLGTILCDLLIQLIIAKSLKGSWKMLYLTQILILAMVGIFMFPTIHYAD